MAVTGKDIVMGDRIKLFDGVQGLYHGSEHLAHLTLVLKKLAGYREHVKFTDCTIVVGMYIIQWAIECTSG